MQPDYFKPHIQTGIALFNMGKKAEAEPYLKDPMNCCPLARPFPAWGYCRRLWRN
jgi:hypothetical protein